MNEEVITMKRFFKTAIMTLAFVIALAAAPAVTAQAYTRTCAKSGCDAAIPNDEKYCYRHKKSTGTKNNKDTNKSTSSKNSSKSSSGKSSSSKSSSSKKSSGWASYDEGYNAIYEDDDYDWNRYWKDSEYASGVDDAMDDVDW